MKLKIVPYKFHLISFFFPHNFKFTSSSCTTKKKHRARKNVEQKKSIYGTAANDGKAGNKNQFITENTKAAGMKRLEQEQKKKVLRRFLENTRYEKSLSDDDLFLTFSVLFPSMLLCFLFL